MFIRTPLRLLAPMALAAALAYPAAAQEAAAPQNAPVVQDAAALLQELQQSLGKQLPRVVRLTVSGSGYKEDGGDTRVHYRIEPNTVEIDSSSPDALATPTGFLAAAMASKPTLTTENLFGATYKVISFTAPNGQPVRGYITEQNVLERIRSERADGPDKSPIEAVFFGWQDFGGMKFPSLMIHKRNDRVQRILVVTKLETGDAPTSKS